MKKQFLILFAILFVPCVLFSQSSAEKSVNHRLYFNYLQGKQHDGKKVQFVGLDWNIMDLQKDKLFLPTFDVGLAINLDDKLNPMGYFTAIPGLTIPFFETDDKSHGNLFIGSGLVFPFLQGGRNTDAGIAVKINIVVLSFSKINFLKNITLSSGGTIFSNMPFPGLGAFSIGYNF